MIIFHLKIKLFAITVKIQNTFYAKKGKHAHN